MKRYLSVILLVVMCMAGVGQAALAENRDYSVEGNYVVRITTPKGRSYIYLYDKPSSTKGNNLGRIDNGDPVYAYYKVRGIGESASYWVYCECRGMMGYIRTSNIASADYSRGTDWRPERRRDEHESQRLQDRLGAHLGTMTVVNCDAWVSLRENPDTSAYRVAKVPKWDEVDAYYYNGRWIGCYYKGMFGFILAEYLTDYPEKYDGYFD